MDINNRNTENNSENTTPYTEPTEGGNNENDFEITSFDEQSENDAAFSSNKSGGYYSAPYSNTNNENGNNGTENSYQPNWQFSSTPEPPYTAPVVTKKASNAKSILISVGINLIVTVIICSITFALFLNASRTKIGENGSLVVFRDGEDLREKVDISETLSNLASDGEAPLTTQEIALKVGPAVVGVVSTGETTTGWFNITTPYESSGSGVIISEDGYIVTNNHVVENATKVTVILNTNEEYAATVIGTDERTDLAVLKIEAKNLTWASLGNSGSVKVGEPVVAIGNPLGMELAGTVTKGIISATNRTIEVEGQSFVLLQTDAAINSGNSGGALVNAYGEVIGINSAKLQATGVEGLSFAIPSDVAKPIIQDLMEVGYVKGRPIIGLIGDNISAEEAEYYGLQEGILVMSVTENSAAKNAGVQRGDLIIKCQGEQVKTIDELNTIRDRYKAGDEITLTVIRNDETIDIPLILGEELQTPQQ